MEDKCRIVSIKQGTCKDTHHNDIYRLELSNGSLFSYRNCYLPQDLPETLTNPETAQGIAININEENAFRFASACLRAEKTALRLITRAEQCSLGLTRKLEKRGHETACVNMVISRLYELKLLDDQRFACLWLESRLRLTRSPRRLLIALRTRGIDREDAETALKTVLDNETEFSLLTRFVRKHDRKSGKSANHDTARSLKYLLKSEGFSLTAIEQYLEQTRE